MLAMVCLSVRPGLWQWRWVWLPWWFRCGRAPAVAAMVVAMASARQWWRWWLSAMAVLSPPRPPLRPPELPPHCVMHQHGATLIIARPVSQHLFPPCLDHFNFGSRMSTHSPTGMARCECGAYGCAASECDTHLVSEPSPPPRSGRGRLLPAWQFIRAAPHIVVMP